MVGILRKSERCLSGRDVRENGLNNVRRRSRRFGIHHVCRRIENIIRGNGRLWLIYLGAEKRDTLRLKRRNDGCEYER